jgi:YesN/AraC family two-component response regulator
MVRKGVRMALGTRTNIGVCGQASNGEEAIEKALRMNPDLIIMDVYMPKMDGLSAANRSKRFYLQCPQLCSQCNTVSR